MSPNSKSESKRYCRAFTLVEMLVVIAIMSILMTAGAIGLGGMSGKGVSSGVATVESLFDEARAIAVGQRTRARVLVATKLDSVPADNLRRIVIAYAKIDPATGVEATPTTWVLPNRGTTLPDQVYFSTKFSMRDQEKKSSFDADNEMTLAATFKAYAGKYTFYEFNTEGICTTPGASFVLGSGARGASAAAQAAPPKITAAGKRDFGGFVVWRNGRTSVFRSPTQISSDIQSLGTGKEF